MDTRARDLETIESARCARIALVESARIEPLDAVLSATGPASRTYLVKVLDVVPGLGKVAGRRLMDSLGLDPFITVGELSPEQRSSVLRGVAS